mmetsp:Transcript_17720/g.32801  ORF Transcript_17720/g.32801 Transcript_17720/m.32801 type:complete len:93 (-) Transcript_17720:69-347(-)
MILEVHACLFHVLAHAAKWNASVMASMLVAYAELDIARGIGACVEKQATLVQRSPQEALVMFWDAMTAEAPQYVRITDAYAKMGTAHKMVAV